MEKLRLERRPEARAFSVEALLQHVRDGKIRIPDFQRPLRWRAQHVLDLFDSVYRGFPVGDLLFYKRPAEAAVVGFGPVHVHAPAVPEAYFVVDGQQRITALAGAMLHPEPRPYGDLYAVWFDLEEERFVFPHGPRRPAHWIPLNVVGDSFALLTWLNEWPFHSQRPDLVHRAIALGKALREYQIPAYIVEGASDGALRLIFKRVNTSGVPMEENEVFSALFRGNDPRPIKSACARLQTATGFGEIYPDLFLICLKAIEGLSLVADFTEAQVLHLDPSAAERTETALLRAIRFLVEDARIVHIKLLPFHLPLALLARFFHIHPRPTERTRTLLSRWLWRGALSSLAEHAITAENVQKMQQISRTIDEDEFASVERLLKSIISNIPRLPDPMHEWTGEGMYLEQLFALALMHLGPRDPETGQSLGTDEIRERLEKTSLNNICVDVKALSRSIFARRLIVSDYDNLDKIPSASPQVLASHGINQDAADALGRGDITAFVEHRVPILDNWLDGFFAERLGEDDNDRPPVAELIRRVDQALAGT